MNRTSGGAITTSTTSDRASRHAFLSIAALLFVASAALTIAPTGETRRGWLTTLVGVGYFFVWTVIGAVVFALGVALAAIEMQQPTVARTVPIAAGVVVVIAGALQFTGWKLRHLGCCRATAVRVRTLLDDAGAAYRYGVRLGLHCAQCCAGLIAILLVIGVMNLTAMAVVAVAITMERVLPAGERVARIIGATVIGMGLFLIAQGFG